jgi:hypothetical protein
MCLCEILFEIGKSLYCYFQTSKQNVEGGRAKGEAWGGVQKQDLKAAPRQRTYSHVAPRPRNFLKKHGKTVRPPKHPTHPIWPLQTFLYSELWNPFWKVADIIGYKG